MSPTLDSRLVIRQARIDDIDGIAGTHCQAFRGALLSRLGAGTVKRYYRCLLDGSYKQHSVVAVDDGTIIGFCFSGVFTGAIASFLRKHLLYMVLQLLIRPHVMFSAAFVKKAKTGAKLLMGPSRTDSRIKPRTDGKTQPEFRVLAIGLLPTRQGSGAATKLIEHCEKAAQDMGFDRIGLTVRTDNGRAIAFYKKLGYHDNQVSKDSACVTMEKNVRVVLPLR